MKILRFLPAAAVLGAIGFLAACNYNPGSTPPPSGTPLDFKVLFHGNYDTFVVDTADANGNNPDVILGSSKIPVSDIVTDTGLTYQGKTHVAKIITYLANTNTAVDSNYFCQDPNGDLYRYNFGFSILNQFTFLTQAIGSNVDVGWVLAAKTTSSNGTSWVARTTDSVLIQSFNIWVYLSSQGEMLADTTFIVGTETIKARHARNTVLASAAANVASGKVIVDSYYSSDINAVVEDFFRHVKLTGLINQQVQGKFKILTSHY
jgi:hypothetical protein